MTQRNDGPRLYMKHESTHFVQKISQFSKVAKIIDNAGLPISGYVPILVGNYSTILLLAFIMGQVFMARNILSNSKDFLSRDGSLDLKWV